MSVVVSTIDVYNELLVNAVRVGIIQNVSNSFIPEIATQAEDVTSDIYTKFISEGLSGLELNSATLGWSAYAGIGAVKFWHDDWNELNNKGIVKALIEPRGIDEMDEFVLDSIGLNLFSGEGKVVNSFFHEMSQKMCLDMIKNFIQGKETKKAAEQFINNRAAMYLLGMRIGMDRIGLK